MAKWEYSKAEDMGDHDHFRIRPTDDAQNEFEFKNNGTLRANSFEDKRGPIMPPGVIVMWSGAADKIPNGWALCNGTKPAGCTIDVPNLTDRFIVAAGSKYSVNNSGDGDNHDHTGKIDSAGAHQHGMPDVWFHKKFSTGSKWGIDTGPNTPDKAQTKGAGDHTHGITILTCGVLRPKWYALCFIIKY